jgi:hypothetical protein
MLDIYIMESNALIKIQQYDSSLSLDNFIQRKAERKMYS